MERIIGWLVYILKVIGITSIAFGIGFIIWQFILCIMADIRVDKNAMATQFIEQSLYPGSKVLHIDYEYEEDDGDYEFDARIWLKSGREKTIEIDCECSCGNWKGCRED